MTVIPKTTLLAISDLVLAFAEQSPNGVVPTAILDDLMVSSGLVVDAGHWSNKTTPEWANRIAMRNRLREKLTALGQKADPPWRLIMESYPSHTDPSELGSMRLMFSGPMMGKVINKRAKRTTDYASATSKMATKFVKQNPNLPMRERAHLELTARIQEILGRMSGEFSVAIEGALGQIDKAMDIDVSGLPSMKNGFLSDDAGTLDSDAA
jgi:hypothetical protein